MNEFGFVSVSATERDISLLLGDHSDTISGEIITIGNGWTMAHIMVRAGVFSSVGDAKRNGWNTQIPEGFSHHVVGKRRINISIVNVNSQIDDVMDEGSHV